MAESTVRWVADRGWLRNLVGDDDRTMRVALVIAAVAVIARTIFWAYTGRVWEDALITALHSENFGRGLGLTHVRQGEGLIHGFTSPISVLVPLLADAFHPGWGLVLIRLVSMLAAALSVLLIFGVNRVVEGLRMPLPLVAAVAGYVALEHHQMLWGVAGMETQMVVAILLFAFYAVAAPLTPWLIGVALALCMYARPDFGFLVLILGAYLLGRAWQARNYRPLFIAVATSALLYGLWLAWTTWYYGSPVPNTILAKAGYPIWTHQPQGAAQFLREAARLFSSHLLGAQTPAFGGHGTMYRSFFGTGPLAWWPTLVAIAFLMVGFAVAIARRQVSLFPLYAFFAVYSIYYVFFVPVIFGWYTVPMNAVCTLLAFKGVRDVVFARRSRLADAGQPAATDHRLWLIAGVYVAFFALFLPVTVRAERNIQELVENRVRLQMGLYLRDKHDPTLTVSGEPLGYIGYYSGLTDYDFPGLASRRVVAFLKAHPGAGLGGLMKGMHPDYLVLRPAELARILGESDRGDWLRRDYVLERHWVVPQADRNRILFADRNIDMDFRLFRKRSTPERRQP